MMLKVISLAFRVFHDEALPHHCICSCMSSPSRWTTPSAMLFLVFIPLFPEENSVSACYTRPQSQDPVLLLKIIPHSTRATLVCPLNSYICSCLFFCAHIFSFVCCMTQLLPISQVPISCKASQVPKLFSFMFIFFFFSFWLKKASWV